VKTYKLTNKVTGMSYIGATIRPLGDRLRDHWNAARHGRTTLICDAIRQFGKEAFVAEVLASADSFEDLMMLEIAAIKEHNTLTPNGYNRASGGLGTPDCRHLESTRLKIADKAKGRVVSEETKAKLSKASKGKPQPWNAGSTGRPAWNTGIPASPETKAKLTAMRTGSKNWNARSIEVNGVVYPCILDAIAGSGLSKMQIRYRLQKGLIRYCNSPYTKGDRKKELQS
jgi:group I intron endonuclease